MRKKLVIFGLIAFVLLSYGLYQALVAAPTEQTMGNVQRIFYYHVPSAWTAFLMFFFAAFAFAAALVFRWYAKRYRVTDNYRA